MKKEFQFTKGSISLKVMGQPVQLIKLKKSVFPKIFPQYFKEFENLSNNEFFSCNFRT